MNAREKALADALEARMMARINDMQENILQRIRITDAVRIRLQLAYNALEGLGGSMEVWSTNIRHGCADDQDADKINDQLVLVRATLAILRGVRSEIPDELRGSTIHDGADAILAADILP